MLPRLMLALPVVSVDLHAAPPPTYGAPVPQVAIFARGPGFGCLRVGDKEYAMRPETGRLGPAEILAARFTSTTETLLVRLKPFADLSPETILAVFERDLASGSGRFLAYAFDLAGVGHATAPQLATLVKNPALRAYLAAPVDGEAAARAAIAAEFAPPPRQLEAEVGAQEFARRMGRRHALLREFREDLGRIFEAKFYDSQVGGKVQRLQRAINAAGNETPPGETDAVSEALRQIETELANLRT